MCQGSATCPSDAPVPAASWACGPLAARSTLPEATYCPFPWGRAPAISCCPSPATRVPDSPRERNQPHRPVALGAHLDLTSYFDRSASPAASIFGPSLHIQLLLTSVCCHPSLSHHCPCLDSVRRLQMASPLALVPRTAAGASSSPHPLQAAPPITPGKVSHVP